MANKPRSPQPRKSNELGSGVALGTSVMVTVVMSPLRESVAVNVPGPLKLGEAELANKQQPPPGERVFACQQGPGSLSPFNEQFVESPLSSNSVTGPKLEVALVKVVVSMDSWKVGESKITSRPSVVAVTR